MVQVFTLTVLLCLFLPFVASAQSLNYEHKLIDVRHALINYWTPLHQTADAYDAWLISGSDAADLLTRYDKWPDDTDALRWFETVLSHPDSLVVYIDSDESHHYKWLYILEPINLSMPVGNIGLVIRLDDEGPCQEVVDDAWGYKPNGNVLCFCMPGCVSDCNTVCPFGSDIPFINDPMLIEDFATSVPVILPIWD